MKTIGALILLLALLVPLSAEGSGCNLIRAGNAHHAGRVYYPRQVFVAPHHDELRIGYNPAGEVADTADKLSQRYADLLKFVLDREDRKDAEFKQLLRQGGGGPLGEGPLPLKADVLAFKHPKEQASCVSCHDASVAKKKGDGEVFYTNGELSASPKDVERMVKAVTKKKNMPPPKSGLNWGVQERLDWLLSMVEIPETAKAGPK